MSPRYRPEDVDTVRERADIVEVVSDHVRLKRAGTSHKGLCPFHQEKTPSFTVQADKGVYYCHGCGAGGNVYTFVQEVEGLTFPEAVEQLAQRYGVELRETDGGTNRRTSPRARLLALHEAAVEHYRELLHGREGARVREYLESRGIAADACDRYRIGFGGWGRDNLTRAMVRKGFTAEELRAGGLVHGEGRTRDMFAGRLLFPIYDPSDRPVGFGGRVIPERFRRAGAPEQPKYLNSRETSLFKKSKILYGANWARGDIVRKRRLVLVEGYTDVIALHAVGVGEAVATCGTSLTEQHMKEISTRFGDVRIVLCLDADDAGQAAMSRERTEDLASTFSPGELVGSSGWVPVGRGWLPEVLVANLPPGVDPAEFAAAEGADGLEAVLSKAVPLVEFLLRRALAGEELTGPEGRARAVRRGAAVLAQVGDGLLRHEYALWLSSRVGVDAYEVSREVNARVERPTQRRPATAAAPSAPVKLSGHHRVEREALRSLAARPDLLADTDIVPDENDFTLPLHRTLFRLLGQQLDADGRVDLAGLASAVADDDLRRAITSLAVGEDIDRDVARDVLVRLKEFSLGRHIDERKERMRSLDPQRDAEAYDALFEELLRLEKQRRTLFSGSPV